MKRDFSVQWHDSDVKLDEWYNHKMMSFINNLTNMKLLDQPATEHHINGVWVHDWLKCEHLPWLDISPTYLLRPTCRSSWVTSHEDQPVTLELMKEKKVGGKTFRKHKDRWRWMIAVAISKIEGQWPRKCPNKNYSKVNIPPSTNLRKGT